MALGHAASLININNQHSYRDTDIISRCLVNRKTAKYL